MKKLLVAASVIGLTFVGVNGLMACDDCVDTCQGPGCVDCFLSEGTVDVNAWGDTQAWGDVVDTSSDGLLMVNAQFGDGNLENGDDVMFQGLAGWSATGDYGAGGEGHIGFQFTKLDAWGVDMVPVEGGDCGDSCVPSYFDMTMFGAQGETGAAAYGNDVAAMTAGAMLGNINLGDPSAGNTFSFANGWSAESFGTDFKEAFGAGADGVNFFNSDLNGSITIPTP